MTTLLIAALLTQCGAEELQSGCCNDGKDARPWRGLNRGVKWEASLDAAKARAAREGKAVLFHQLVGDVDREGC